MQFWGSIAGAEVTRAANELGSDSDFDGLRYVIIDFSEVAEQSIDESTLRDVAVIRIGARANNPNIRLAFVATDHSFASLAARMDAEADVGKRRTEMFSTMADARDWLGKQPALTAIRRFASK
jgi:hypothetical protein